MKLSFTNFKANSGIIGVVTLFLVCLSFLSSDLNAQKKYILFDNLDPAFIDSAYYYNFIDQKDLNAYYPNLIRAPFSDATFSQNSITSFDLAIFPMGNNKLSYSSGSSTVIGKIKEMIAAGKNVIITGRDFLNKALGVGSDKNPDVLNFLQNTMGIEFIKKKKVSSNDGSTISWWSFFIRGHSPDPVGISAIKACNFTYEERYGTPLAYPVYDLDVFKSKDETKYFPVEHFIYGQNDVVSDTLVATRTEVGQSRIVLYSMGFEPYCGTLRRAELLYRCMVWALGNIRPDGPAIQNDPPNIDFDRVPLDSSRTMNVTISSVGKQDLEISETSFWENPDDAYSIVSGEVKASGPSIKLKYGQTHVVGIQFKPKTKKNYAGIFSITTNATVDNIKDINLLGVGGIDNGGPQIATNFGKLIDFGKVKKATSKTVDLVLYNDGDKELTIQKFRMDTTLPDRDRFTFAQTLPNPLFVKVKDSLKIKVKFAATVNEERVFTGRINVECDAKNDAQFSIELSGEIAPFTGVDDPIALTGENFSMSISPNPASDNTELTCNLQFGSAKMNLYLTDLSGVKLMQIANSVISTGEQKFSIRTQSLANGKYFVVAEIDGKRFVTNFIVSK